MQSPGDTACGDKVLVWLTCCDQATQIEMCIGWLTVAVVGFVLDCCGACLVCGPQGVRCLMSHRVMADDVAGSVWLGAGWVMVRISDCW